MPDLGLDSGLGGLLRTPLLLGIMCGIIGGLLSLTPPGTILRQRFGIVIAAATAAAGLTTLVPWGIAVPLVLAAGLALTLAQLRPAPDTALSFALLAVTAAGVYGTLPETEGSLALLGVLLVAAVVALLPGVEIGASGWLACVLLVLGLVAVDGHRGGAYVGGAACLGFLLVLPALQDGRPTLVWRVAVFASHTAYVIYASRGPGLERSAGTAAGRLVLPSVSLALVAGMLAVAARELRAGSPATFRAVPRRGGGRDAEPVSRTRPEDATTAS